MENQTVEFKNADSSLFIRLESGSLYGNDDVFVAFWRKSEDAQWERQGNMPAEQWDAQIAHLESNGFERI